MYCTVRGPSTSRGPSDKMRTVISDGFDLRYLTSCSGRSVLVHLHVLALRGIHAHGGTTARPAGCQTCSSAKLLSRQTLQTPRCYTGIATALSKPAVAPATGIADCTIILVCKQPYRAHHCKALRVHIRQALVGCIIEWQSSQRRPDLPLRMMCYFPQHIEIMRSS